MPTLAPVLHAYVPAPLLPPPPPLHRPACAPHQRHHCRIPLYQDIRDAAGSVSAEVTTAKWQSHSPVFHTVTLPQAAALLAEIANMHEREAAAKMALVESIRQLVQNLDRGGLEASAGGGVHPAARSGMAAAGAGTGGGVGGSSSTGGGSSSTGKGTGSAGGSSSSGSGSTQQLRERLTVAIATWLSRPFIDDERADLILGMLTEDMTGF